MIFNMLNVYHYAPIALQLVVTWRNITKMEAEWKQWLDSKGVLGLFLWLTIMHLLHYS